MDFDEDVQAAAENTTTTTLDHDEDDLDNGPNGRDQQQRRIMDDDDDYRDDEPKDNNDDVDRIVHGIATTTNTALHDQIFGGDSDDDDDLSDIGDFASDEDEPQKDKNKKLTKGKKTKVSSEFVDEEDYEDEEGKDRRSKQQKEDEEADFNLPPKLPKIKIQKRKKTPEELANEEESEKKTKKKKKKRSEDQVEEEPRDPDAPPSKASLAAADFEAALERIKNKRPKKRGDGDDTAFDEEIQGLIHQMDQAAVMDVQANLNQKPATSKIKLLPFITEKMLSKTHLYNKLIDNHILTSMRLWLEPLKDGSLPNLDVQSAIINTLAKMSIGDTTLLRESNIGAIIMFYTKCDRVNAEIKKTASMLVDRWMRLVLDRPKSYKEKTYTAVQVDITQKRPQVKVRYDDAGESSRTPKTKAEERMANRTIIPKPVTVSYDLVPESNIRIERGSGRMNDPVMKKMRTHILNLKRKK